MSRSGCHTRVEAQGSWGFIPLAKFAPPGESGLSRVSGLLNFSLKAFHVIREVASSGIKDSFLGVQRIKHNFLKKEGGALSTQFNRASP